MKLNRVMIAAPKSGSGKTTITCALLKILKDNGESVVSFKCGPDYIDPMFHNKVIGIPSKNLDTFFTDINTTRELFVRDLTEDNFVVMEGVMGLYDGLGGVKEEGSSYNLAKITDTPIVLVIDAKGMGRSLIPMISGFLSYDSEHLIKGIILNKISKSYYEIIRPLIEKELNVEVLGYFPEHKETYIQSRHLGLVLPDEITNLQDQLTIVSDELKHNININALKAIAGNAKEIEYDPIHFQRKDHLNKLDETPIIAVAWDEAFCFYYHDNLHLLEDYGAKLEYFSPLHDNELPKNCHAVLIGGGYPENYADQLSKNISMLSSIKTAFDKGMPFVVECGGFMYLHESLIDEKGMKYNMVGAVPGTCEYTGRLVRFGYIEIKENQSSFLPEDEIIKGHEFHYYDSTNNGKSCIAKKPLTGREYSCIIEGDNYWIGFPHLYYPSNPAFAQKFVEKAEEYKKHCVC